jgi:hypothetical protein
VIAVKVAEIVILCVTVIVVGFVEPERSPLHELKEEPALGVAVTLTDSPE